MKKLSLLFESLLWVFCLFSAYSCEKHNDTSITGFWATEKNIPDEHSFSVYELKDSGLAIRYGGVISKSADPRNRPVPLGGTEESFPEHPDYMYYTYYQINGTWHKTGNLVYISCGKDQTYRLDRGFLYEEGSGEVLYPWR